jgi:acyl-CoA synthetase (AMP-forming)/AMP-acid ligase II
MPPIPGDAQSIPELIRRRAAALGDAEALVDPTARLSFAELDHITARWAAALFARGLVAGDRVAVSLPNGVPIAVSFLAAMRLGLIWVGVNRAYVARERYEVLTDCGARALLTNGDLLLVEPPVGLTQIDVESAQWMRELADSAHVADGEVDPSGAAAIAYTSGTTGVPKGVVHSQRNILLPGAVARLRGDGGGRIGMYLPMTSLNMQVLGTVYALLNGECLVCIPRSDAASVVAAVRDESIVRLSASPATVHDILRDPTVPRDALATLTALTLGGGPTNPQLSSAFQERFGRRFLSGYGLTEAPSSVTRERPDAPSRDGNSGPPLPQFEIDIVGDDGSVLPHGEIGEICIHASTSGPLAGVYTPMLGYWNNPAATAAALLDGRLHTGDFGSLDADGELYVADRRVDLIVRGGSNVYPAEIERVLLADSRIVECAVVARADERLGQLPVAFVQRAAGASLDAADVMLLAGASLAPFKVPVDVVFIDEFPRNQMGKIVRAALRERLAAQPGAATSTADTVDG